MMVVDPRFFSPFQVDLAIVRNSLTVADGNLSCVLDVNGNVIFIIKDKNFSLHDRHILLDASEIPILTFQKKHRSIHRRWQAFRGYSTNPKDLIFSTKKTSLIQRVTELNVFLSDNKEENVGDYKVAGDWKKRSSTVYSYDGGTILAQHRSIHRRWQAFRGYSTNPKDLIFSTKKTSLIQRVTELNVFLSDNKEENVGDYKVAGDWKKRSSTVYSYDGGTILAQMHDKHIDTCIDSDKDTYGITVSPNVDYALVVALMVILYEVNKDRKKRKIKGEKKGSDNKEEAEDKEEEHTDDEEDLEEEQDDDDEDSDSD